MLTSSIDRLPPGPPERTGWPWTKTDIQELDISCKGFPWPRLSIVTSSLNQGQFLEETIRSVLLQGYPSLEYFVLDGGSQDNSREILEKYSPFLSYWHSKRDAGQSDAITQGLRMATGEIVAWINSDDYYLPGAFATVVEAFRGKDTQIVYGRSSFVDEQSGFIEEYPARQLQSDWRRFRYWRGWPIPQPTVFMRRHLLEQYGYLDLSLHYALDYELFIRLSCHVKLNFLDVPLANYRIHKSSKTGNWAENQDLFHRETLRVNRRYATWYFPENWRLWLEWSLYVLMRRPKNVLRPFVRRWKNG